MNASPEKVAEFPAMSYDDVRERVREAMTADGLSNSTVAREAGLAPSTMSEFLTGKYKGDNHGIAASLLKWLNSRAQSEQMRQLLPGVPGWIETPTSKKIAGVLTFVQAFEDIGVIYGGAGLSKTTTIRRYGDKNPNVFVTTATPATAGSATMLAEIASSIGLRDIPLHPARLQASIVKHLKGTKGLLVIDEAQHLTKQALESARSLHDACGVGLALAGNAAVYNQLWGRHDNGFAQFFSRIGRRLALTKPLRGDVHAIAAAYGVRDKDSIALCEEIARRPGALRMQVKVLRLAMMGSDGGKVEADAIRSAWNELQGEQTDGGDYV